MEGMAQHHDADDSDESFGERLFIWLGKLHVAVIYFSIALIVAAFAAEAFGAICNRPAWRSSARIMLLLAAFGAVVAATLSWFAGGFPFLWADVLDEIARHEIKITPFCHVLMGSDLRRGLKSSCASNRHA